MKLPYSTDGSTLDETCRHKDGYFRIGNTGYHEHVKSLELALKKLALLKVARWRRPSATTGKQGTVTAIRWA